MILSRISIIKADLLFWHIHRKREETLFCCEYSSPVDWLLPHSVRWFRKEVKAGLFRMSRVKDIGAQICPGSNDSIPLANIRDICVSLFRDRCFLLREQAVWQRSFHQKIARAEVTKPDFRWSRYHECPLVVIWERMSRFGKDARRSSIIKMKRYRILTTWSAVTGVAHGKTFYAMQTNLLILGESLWKSGVTRETQRASALFAFPTFLEWAV